MEILEHVSLASKTTMRIGGTARFFAEPTTKKEVTEAVAFADEKNLPLLLLGGGSNTIFADGEVQAVVLRIKGSGTNIEGNTVTVEAGKHLAVLLNELAAEGLDLSPLTGIPGSVGGAVVGNAGQGPQGVWIDSFVDSVTVFAGGKWKEMTKEECEFSYRESVFKKMNPSPIIWEVRLVVPSGNPSDIHMEIERLLQKRIETQPHSKTAGSCFKAVGGTPAWQLIDAVGMRGMKVGGVSISEKHANFLINDGNATFSDAIALIEKTKQAIPDTLEVEMRLIQEDGTLL